MYSTNLLLIIGTFNILMTSCEMATAMKTHPYSTEAESCREFSTKLFNVTSIKAEENVIISPLSVHVILSYLCHGADGKTATELINSLFIKQIDRLHIGYKKLLFTLNSIKEAELRFANAIFVHDGVQLLPAFSLLGRDFYNFIVLNMNFQDNIESAKIINNWVIDKTNNKISEIIQPSDVTDDTKAIIINAIYFKGPWKYPFNRAHTINRNFYVTKDIERQVPMMKNKNHYIHGELPDLKSKFIEIPYSDENISMVVILPDSTSNLSSLEKKFNWNIIVNAETRKQEIILYLPKFKIECTLNLKETLRKIGFESMFEDNADFSGMTHTPLKINKIIQKAFIEVNEKGSEAAVATAVQMRLKRALMTPEEFIVDRPFMIAIHHKPSNIPLFIGSIRNIGISTEKDEL